MKKAIFILITLALAQAARADYHYASHEGSNTYPYTSWATGAHLIQDAVNATDPHDTLYIGSGDWFETVATDVYDSIAIIGMGMDSTFCYSDSFHTPVMTIDYGCSVEGISFHHLDDWICLRAGVYAGVRIGECGFFRSKIGIQASGLPTEITNCVFDSCEYGIQSGVWIGDFLIRNNLLLNSYNRAIYLQVHSAIVENNIIISVPGTFSGAVGGAPTGPVHIRNNVAINGAWGFGAGSMYQDDRYNNIAKDINRIYDSYGIAVSNDTIFNNLIINCTNGIFVYGTENEIDYNAFWRNTNNFQYSGFDSIGNIFVDPMLVSDEDFHLQAFSPLIDAGNPEVLDIDGTRSDIGVYGGPHGCSYTYLDLAPRIPDSIQAFIDSGVITLEWLYNTEADFNRYQIYRDTVPGFDPSIFDIIAEPDTSYYEDTDIIPGTPYYYRLTSVDNQENISDFSEEITVLPTSAWDIIEAALPYEPRITSAYPNPFNSNIVIVYSASNLGPQPPQVTLQVYDIQGRVVKTLVDGRIPQGTYRAVWDGTNDVGEKVSSGTYIARVSQWGQSAGDFPMKITLIK
jgi:hypothetical protein